MHKHDGPYCFKESFYEFIAFIHLAGLSANVLARAHHFCFFPSLRRYAAWDKRLYLEGQQEQARAAAGQAELPGKRAGRALLHAHHASNFQQQATSCMGALRCIVASIPLGNVLPVRSSDAAGNRHSQLGD
jgi:hypothetical protein